MNSSSNWTWKSPTTHRPFRRTKDCVRRQVLGTPEEVHTHLLLKRQIANMSSAKRKMPPASLLQRRVRPRYEPEAESDIEGDTSDAPSEESAGFDDDEELTEDDEMASGSDEVSVFPTSFYSRSQTDRATPPTPLRTAHKPAQMLKVKTRRENMTMTTRMGPPQKSTPRSSPLVLSPGHKHP